MKTQQKKVSLPTVATEEQYRQFFAPFMLPSRGLYTDQDSLEQPSALKYVPNTTTPSLVS
jgi:hypothetical protein